MTSRPTISMLLAVLAATLTGCASSRHDDGHANHHPKPAGAAQSARHNTHGDQARGLAEFMAIANAPRADWYEPQEAVTGGSRSAVEGMIAATGGGRRYRVFFGGVIEGTSGRTTYLNSDPEVRIDTGFGLAWGWRPYITTTRVTTATDGTTIMAQVDGAVHRVFLLSGGTARVDTRPRTGCGGSWVELTTPWTYVECTEVEVNGVRCTVLSAPMELADNPELLNTVRNIVKRHRVKQLMP